MGQLVIKGKSSRLVEEFSMLTMFASGTKNPYMETLFLKIKDGIIESRMNSIGNVCTVLYRSKEFNIEGEGPINNQKAQSEFGDLLFSLVNYARFIDINPEEALERTNKKFIRRFQYLESESAKDGKNLAKMSLVEMDTYWEKAKDL